MKVKVVRSFGAHSRGEILDPPGGICRQWLRFGWVEIFSEDGENQSDSASDDDAPWGRKKDGTPKRKPGRKSK